jgi:hypothetical protein
MNTHDTANISGRIVFDAPSETASHSGTEDAHHRQTPADFLDFVEGKADIAAESKRNIRLVDTSGARGSSGTSSSNMEALRGLRQFNDGEKSNEVSHATGIADSYDHSHAAGQQQTVTNKALSNREMLENITFESLAHGLSDERVTSLLNVLGWPEEFSCFAVGGTAASTFERARSVIRHKAHDLGSEYCLVGRDNGLTIGLIVVQGASTPEVTCTAVMPAFDHDKPVCLGPTRRNVEGAMLTLEATTSAFRVLPAIHPLSRPARAADMLPERALIGDADAIDELYHSVYASLKSDNDNDPTLQTITSFLDSGGSLDIAAKMLNVHPNTVRYRIKRAADATGWDANDPRDAYVLRTAIIIGTICEAENI